MNLEEFEKLPIIGLQDTMTNDPTGYTETQKFLLPYIDTYHNFLWLCFFGTLFFVIFKFLILPLVKDLKTKTGTKK